MITILIPHHGTSTPAHYDEEDETLLSGYSWWMHRGGYVSGSKKGAGARKAKTEYMHRLVARPGPGLQVDHINGNKADNRRANLRCVPQTLNNLNQNNRLRSDNTHGFRGVSLHRPSGLWQARVTIAGVRYNLGYFETAALASVAYQARVQQWLPAQCLEPRPAPDTLLD